MVLRSVRINWEKWALWTSCTNSHSPLIPTSATEQRRLCSSIWHDYCGDKSTNICLEAPLVDLVSSLLWSFVLLHISYYERLTGLPLTELPDTSTSTCSHLNDWDHRTLTVCFLAMMKWTLLGLCNFEVLFECSSQSPVPDLWQIWMLLDNPQRRLGTLNLYVKRVEEELGLLMDFTPSPFLIVN